MTTMTARAACCRREESAIGSASAIESDAAAHYGDARCARCRRLRHRANCAVAAHDESAAAAVRASSARRGVADATQSLAAGDDD